MTLAFFNEFFTEAQAKECAAELRALGHYRRVIRHGLEVRAYA